MSKIIDTLNFDGITAAKQKENSQQFSDMWPYLFGRILGEKKYHAIKDEFKWKIHSLHNSWVFQPTNGFGFNRTMQINWHLHFEFF